MNLAELIPSMRLFSVRFLLVSVFPTATLLATIIALMFSGAPQHAPDLSLAIKHFQQLTAAQITLLSLAAIVMGILLYPLQFSMIQILEGYWGASRPLVLAALLTSRRYGRKRDRWDDGRQGLGYEELPADELQRVVSMYGSAVASLPRPGRMMPTRLGNVLRAAEDSAGERYGLNTLLIIPRLVPQLSPMVADRLSDSRLQLDIAVRFCLIWLIATATSIGLLVHFAIWLWVPVATYGLAWLSYRAACAAAAAYGNMLAVAVDLHRFDLLAAMHQPLPRNYRDEVRRNRTLMRILSGEFAYLLPDASTLPRIGYKHPSQDLTKPPDGEPGTRL